MDKLYIVIPAYNEEETIEDVAREWHQIVEKIGEDSRLVIINDGSKDSTYEKLLELKNVLPQLEPVSKRKQRSWGHRTLGVSICHFSRCGLHFPDGLRWADHSGRILAPVGKAF